MDRHVEALFSIEDPNGQFFNCSCGWTGGKLLYVGYTYNPMESRLECGQGVCPNCYRPFQGCFHIEVYNQKMGIGESKPATGYQEQSIEVSGISFHRSSEEPGNIWAVMYVSDALKIIEDSPVVIKLRMGQRVDGQAWSASLHVGEHSLFRDNSEYAEASDAIGRVQTRLNNTDGRNIDEFEHAKAILHRGEVQQ